MDKEKILEIYTDASGGGGFGNLFINPDETERQYSYCITNNQLYDYFQEEDIKFNELSISVLETFAIYVAIKKLKTYSNEYDKVILYTDHMSAYEFLSNVHRNKRNQTTLPKSRIDRIIIIKIKEMLKELKSKIEFRHIKAHCRVYGNELADRLAKKGQKDKNYYSKTRRRNLDVFCNSLFHKKRLIYSIDKNDKPVTEYVNII